MRSSTELQMEIGAPSQAVNTDIPVNPDSQAATTQYQRYIRDRTAAKAGIEYQIWE